MHFAELPAIVFLRFLNMYLDGVKSPVQSVLCKNIALSLGRSINAIKLRVLEVNCILGGARDFPNVTPNMVVAVEQVINERDLSRARMEILF